MSRWPVHDFNHRTTSDMWLYRAYSGNLYHNGEQALTLTSFTQGDFITCVLDMEARTISFGKNGEVRSLDLFLPCYSCLLLNKQFTIEVKNSFLWQHYVPSFKQSRRRVTQCIFLIYSGYIHLGKLIS